MFYVLRRVHSILFVLGMFCVSGVYADDAADLNEVRNFQLTEKRLDQFAQAMRNMGEAIEKNHELAKEDDSLGNDASIDEMVAAFDKIPPMKICVESTGMSLREFVLFQMALLSAAMGDYVIDQGQKLPAEISAQHVKFYQAHEQRFQALQKEWEAMENRMEGDRTDEQLEENPGESEE